MPSTDARSSAPEPTTPEPTTPEPTTPEPTYAEAAGPSGTRRGSSGDELLSATLVVLPFLVLLTSFVLITRHDALPLSNSDTYFHLRFGQEFLQGHWSLRHPGSVTTFGTNDWVPTQWLPQVAMAQLESWFGLAGVAWLAGLMHLALAVTLWFVARRYAGPLVAMTVVGLALLTASPGLSMRPQVLSYLCVAVTTAAWLSTREDRKARWWLVPMTWLWAMSHGMWPIGILIGLVACVGIALDRAATPRQWLRMASVPVASAIAAALTPVGPALYPAVLLVNSRAKYFAEWQPPRFTSPDALVFLLLAGLLLLRLWRRRDASSWTEILLVGLAGGWALYTGRTVMIAAMMLVPLGALALQEVVGPRPRISRLERVLVLGGAAACLGVLAVLAPRTADQPPPDPAWFSELDDLPADTVVLNDWGEGGYFMWRFPELDFVMNGYGDIFTDSELERNFRMDGGQAGWRESVVSTRARYALLAPGSRLAYNLATVEGWSTVHRDADWVLLTAPVSWPDR